MKQSYRQYTKEYMRELTRWQRIYPPKEIKFAMLLRRIGNHGKKRGDIHDYYSYNPETDEYEVM